MINIATILKHNVIGKLLNHVVLFFINVLMVRLLGVSESGTYFNELYLLNFIVFIFSAGLDYTVIALYTQEPELLPFLRLMLFRAVVIFVFVITFYVFLVLPRVNNYFHQPAVAILLFGIGNLLLIFYQGLLAAMKKFNFQNLVLGACNTVFLVYLLIIYKHNEQVDLSGLQNVYAALFFLQGVLLWWFSREPGKKVTVSVSTSVVLKNGFYIMFSSLIYFAFLRIDNFFVEKYSDSNTLGNYVQCGKIGQYFLYFSAVISSTLLPFIAAEAVGSSFNEWKRMMRPYIICLCSAALAIGLFGKQLFPLLFGTDFHQMYYLVVIMLPGFVCLGVLTLINAVYIGKGNIRKIFTGDLAGLIIVTGLDTWLVPLYGARAAAIVSSGAYCLVFLFLWTGFKKQFSLPAKIAKINTAR